MDHYLRLSISQEKQQMVPSLGPSCVETIASIPAGLSFTLHLMRQIESCISILMLQIRVHESSTPHAKPYVIVWLRCLSVCSSSRWKVVTWADERPCHDGIETSRLRRPVTSPNSDRNRDNTIKQTKSLYAVLFAAVKHNSFFLVAPSADS